jgi:hypothetical protein
LPSARSAGTNGVTTALAEATGGAELMARPATVACTASGCAQIGWLPGPVSAEVHHWLVGTAMVFLAWPFPLWPFPLWPGAAGAACVGARLGRAAAGGVAAILPAPA